MLAFFILIVCSCTAEPTLNETVPANEPPPSDIVPYQELPVVSEEPAFEEPGELPFEYVLAPGFDRGSGIYLYDDSHGAENLTFDLNELPIAGLSAGEWTVNEIEERFGAADEISARIESPSLIEIILKYNEIDVVLNNNRNGELSFDSKSNPLDTQHTLKNEDKAMKMQIRRVNLHSALPRGLVIGESTVEHVKAAYPPDSGREHTNIDEHILAFSYIDFDKLAAFTKCQKPDPDIAYLNYFFQDDILVVAILYF